MIKIVHANEIIKAFNNNEGDAKKAIINNLFGQLILNTKKVNVIRVMATDSFEIETSAEERICLPCITKPHHEIEKERIVTTLFLDTIKLTRYDD